MVGCFGSFIGALISVFGLDEDAGVVQSMPRQGLVEFLAVSPRLPEAASAAPLLLADSAVGASSLAVSETSVPLVPVSAAASVISLRAAGSSELLLTFTAGGASCCSGICCTSLRAEDTISTTAEVSCSALQQHMIM